MKKLFVVMFACTLLSVPTLSYAEEQNEEVSKSTTIEFLGKDGALILKEFYPSSKVGGVDFQVLILSDVVNREKIGCLRVETSYYSQYSSDTYTGTLDNDELSACIQSLTHIKNSVLPTTPQNYTECEYQTRDGVKFGAYYDVKKAIWKVYVQPKKYSSRSIAYLNNSDLDKIIMILGNAQSTIQEALNK